MQPQNHGSSLKQIVNRNCKVLSPNPQKPCNLKPAQNRKIDSRSAAYAFFTSDYFDSIPHDELLRSVARRIGDRYVLGLIKLWLKAPIEERDDGEGPGASLVARTTRAARLTAASRAGCSPTST